MGYKARAGQQPVKRGVSPDEGAIPAAQTEVEAHRRPPMVTEDGVDSIVEDDSSGMAGGESGATGGSSSMPGHPDAER